MLAPMYVALTAVLGYVLGSIPIANLVARRRAGIDLRERGDRNPGYWNAKASLGSRAALPVFVGDVAKGAVAAGLGVFLEPDLWWAGYVGGAAAMVGHAWPVFARFRGGRSVLCFVGAVIVLAPVPAGITLLTCLLVWTVTRRFDVGARAGVFGFPVVQAVFEPRAHVAASGALMSIIGLRFAMAAVAERRRAREHPTGGTPDQPG